MKCARGQLRASALVLLAVCWHVADLWAAADFAATHSGASRLRMICDYLSLCLLLFAWGMYLAARSIRRIVDAEIAFLAVLCVLACAIVHSAVQAEPVEVVIGLLLGANFTVIWRRNLRRYFAAPDTNDRPL